MSERNDPVTAFVTVTQEAVDALTELMEIADDHYGIGSADINWGHVGTARHITLTVSSVLLLAREMSR